ncbi:hypothetical protein THAOC_04508 [Thalassiosira oceanica]|uniref:Uncharacterized protein n=1 Tax=Thalassiosira oceanica TaxID=159749 RepID=K0T9S7_THAOC|nr:hypothetical protein THAOC_04508 [Thalassiosira oceanica]|eukprot:EJK73849.1 hypothetical protein THAOC_04508 [Thalassiosira oceanica]
MVRRPASSTRKEGMWRRTWTANLVHDAFRLTPPRRFLAGGRRLKYKMKAEMAAVADFLDVVDRVQQALGEASPVERALRSKSSKGTKKHPKTDKSLETCEEDLLQCQEKSDDTDESYLYIQTSDTCRIERSPLGRGFAYRLFAALDESTYKFTDRPATMEVAVATGDFVSDFASTFVGSPPNVGLTFVDIDSGEFEDPIVVSASSPTMTGGVTTYDIDQSPFQQGVDSISRLFDNASRDQVQFIDCSLFFDSSSSVASVPMPPPVPPANGFCAAPAQYPIISSVSLYNKCQHAIRVDGWDRLLEPSAHEGKQYVQEPMCSNVQCESPLTAGAGSRISYWFDGYMTDTYSMIELTMPKEPSWQCDRNPDGSWSQNCRWVDTGNGNSGTPRCCGPPSHGCDVADTMGERKLGYFGPGTWLGVPNFSDYPGWSIPVSMQAIDSSGGPACDDSGMKTTYIEPNWDGLKFTCPYGGLKPNNGFLCMSPDFSSVDPVIKRNSWAWNPQTPSEPWGTYFTSSNINVKGGVTNMFCNDICQRTACNDSPGPQNPACPIGILTKCSKPVQELEIVFCPDGQEGDSGGSNLHTILINDRH